MKNSSHASKRKLVVFAPYPPAKNGIADYVFELMPFHLKEFDVTLVIADDAPIPDDPRPRVLLASEFHEHRAAFETALKIYHVGNNAQHCYMLDLLRQNPGVVVLHDFNLCYLNEMATLRWGDRERHLAAMEAEYGALGRDLVTWQLERGHRELFAGYELPLNGEVLEAATAVITHSRQVQYRVAARVPQTPVWYVPHHLSPRVSEFAGLSKSAARKRLGLPQSELLVTALGFVTRAKQIPLALSALASLRGRVPPFRFILAGERRPDEYDVDADIARSGLKSQVICTDYLDEELFFHHLAAADIIVNLRYPSGGEMSGTLIRALGMGLPTLVLDLGPMGELPDQVVRKIAWQEDSQDALTKALHQLMSDASARSALGARASAYIGEVHAVERIADRYSRVLHEAPPANRIAHRSEPLTLHFPGSKNGAARLRRLERRGEQAVREADGRLWWQTGSAPLGSDNDKRALVVCANPAQTSELLSGMFGWAPDAITAMSLDAFLGPAVRSRDGDPVPAGSFAFALVVVPSDLEEHQAALLMRRLNGALQNGASIAFEIHADATKPENRHAPLVESHLGQRLRDAGFASVREFGPQDGFIPELVVPCDDETETRRFACATARKVSDYSVWRFAFALEGLPLRHGGRLNAPAA